MALVQPLAQGSAQVLDLFFIDRQVRMPRDAKVGERAHLPPGEQIRQAIHAARVQWLQDADGQA